MCGAEHFCKASAVLPALERSRALWVAVVDADVWCAGTSRTYQRLEGGPEVWGRPHRDVYRLSREGTEDFKETGNPHLTAANYLVQEPYTGLHGGGYVMAKRTDLLDIPLDKRFVGWGGEDEAWGIALHTLLGPPYMNEYPLIHLYHESQSRMDRRTGSFENERIRQEYVKAAGKVDKMQDLIAKVKDANRSLP